MSDQCPTYISARSAEVILSDVRPIKLKPEALHSINVLVDEILYNILAVARSLATDRLKPALLRVLPTSLGKEALLEAEVELKAYWDRTGTARSPSSARSNGDTQDFDLQWSFEVSVLVGAARMSELCRARSRRPRCSTFNTKTPPRSPPSVRCTWTECVLVAPRGFPVEHGHARGAGGRDVLVLTLFLRLHQLLRLKCEAYSTMNDSDEDADAEKRLQQRMEAAGSTTPPNPALLAPAALYLTAILE